MLDTWRGAAPEAAGPSVAERLGVDPGELLLIGDTRIDAETARNAGSRFGLVLWGFPDPPALAGLAADFRASEPEEVCRALLGR